MKHVLSEEPAPDLNAGTADMLGNLVDQTTDSRGTEPMFCTRHWLLGRCLSNSMRHQAA
jgi:hypothetical protein